MYIYIYISPQLFCGEGIPHQSSAFRLKGFATLLAIDFPADATPPMLPQDLTGGFPES